MIHGRLITAPGSSRRKKIQTEFTDSEQKNLRKNHKPVSIDDKTTDRESKAEALLD